MYNTGRRYNTTTRYNATPAPAPWFAILAHAQPVLVDAGLRPVAVLHAAHEIFIDETLGGEDKLTFKTPFPVPAELTTGALVDMAGRIYRVMITHNAETAEGLRLLNVEAWARWYDLAKMPELPAREFAAESILGLLWWLLPGSHWSVGEVAVHHRRNIQFRGGVDRLAFMREMERMFSAEIAWDTRERRVSFLPAGGIDNGLFFLRGRNLRKFEIAVDFSDTIHRLYPRGRSGMSIAAVNAGVTFIEVPSPHDPPPSAVLVAEEFTDPAELLAFAHSVFGAMNAPRVSYACDVVDVSALPGATGPQVGLGDIVDVYDERIDFRVKTRVVRERYDVLDPWSSQIELANSTLDLSSVIRTLHRQANRLDEWIPLPVLPWEPVVGVAESVSLSIWLLSVTDSATLLQPEDVRPAAADSTTLPTIAVADTATVTLT